MLNLLPKGIIINNIVDTLKKDPENGVVKLLEKAESNAKTTAATGAEKIPPMAPAAPQPSSKVVVL